MTSSPPLRRSARLSALTFVLALGAILAFATPASAHDELIGSDPANGAAVETLPAELNLTFSAEILDEGAELQVTDAAGTSLVEEPPVIAGTTLTQPLSGDGSDLVTVLWRVVSSDGHPISGEFSFTVTAAPTADPTPTATESASAAPSATTPVGVEPSPTASAPSGDSGPLPWVLIGILVIGAGGALVAVLVARARGNGGAGPTSDG